MISHQARLDAHIRGTLKLWAPNPRLNVAQWAEKELWLPRSMSSEPGKYRGSRLPYQIEPQEKACDPYAGGVVLLWAKQLGKTQIFLNVVAYRIGCAPGHILVKYPSLESAKSFSRKKLGPLIRYNPTLQDRMQGDRYRDSGNTILTKDFAGGSVSMVGANSATGLRQLSCQTILQDEIDADRDNNEGDPVDQADGRAENYHDACFMKSSTPTIKGHSRIEAVFLKSDQRYWFVRCPKCEHEQTLKWGSVEWPEGKPEEAFYRCSHCRGEWTDLERIRAVMGGRWIATNPTGDGCGYHLSGLYRIMGKKRKFQSYLHEFVAGFLKAKGSKSRLMFWTNTFLAETWIDDTERIETHPILTRRESYQALPLPVCVLTAAVDVQHDRLEVEIVGWGEGEESWGVERIVIMGSPLRDGVWKELDQLRERYWNHAGGGRLKVSILAIDTGGQHDNHAFSSKVYAYVARKQQATRGQPGVVAVKGASQRGAPMASQVDQKNGIKLLFVGTDRAKATIFERLKLKEPGPGYMHFPTHYAEEFFDQLTAEELQTVMKSGYPARVWVKVRERNEALDIRVYNQAALELLNPDFKALAKLVGATPAAAAVTVVNPQPEKLEYVKRLPADAPPVFRRRTPFRRR